MSSSDEREDIAITGMACRYAGSDGLRPFWLRVLEGAPAFSDPPDSEAERFHDPQSTRFNRVSTLRGGYLRDLWQSSPAALGRHAATQAGINPEQGLALDLASQAIRDADYSEKEKGMPRERTAVVIGYAPCMDPAGVNWLQQGLVVDQTLDLVRRCFPHGGTQDFEVLFANLQKCLPPFDSRNLPGLFPHTLATRIAQRFNFQGMACTVNGDSASTHLAMQTAMDELRAGRADVVLAGGITGVLSPQLLMPFDQLGYLSGGDVVHPFGQDAGGTLLGEGGGLFVLKRAQDARRGGDRVYALLRSVSLAANGQDEDPEEGLARAVGRCLAQAGAAPETVAMIEGHGSGIVTQDRSEVRALRTVFGTDRCGTASIALGSVKALVGHCGFAAGAAGIIKAALSLYHRIIPPAQEAGHPHPQLKLEETPFYLNPQSRPWVHNDAGQPRRAGVNAMAIGGIAAHALLEQLPGEQ